VKEADRPVSGSFLRTIPTTSRVEVLEFLCLGEEGQDWVLTYTPEKRDPGDREKVLVRLTPRALHELYIETKDLDTKTRQMGHRAECDLCGEMVDMERAIPEPRGEPCHRHCWAEYTGAPDWFTDY